MAEIPIATLTLTPPGPSEPVPIDLGDGKKRFLRYTISTMMRLKRTLGRSVLGRNGLMTNLDEELLPQLILAGLRNEDGSVCTDFSIERIEELPAMQFSYLLRVFTAAFMGSLVPPEKNETPPEIPQSPKPN